MSEASKASKTSGMSRELSQSSSNSIKQIPFTDPKDQDAQLKKPSLIPEQHYLRINHTTPLQLLREQPLFNKIDRLAYILRSRPIHKHDIKVIAVDSSDPEVVKSVLQFVTFQIGQCAGNLVRVFDDDWVRARMPDIKDLTSYKQYIDLWASLWRFIIQAPLRTIPGPVVQTAFDGHSLKQHTYLSPVDIIPFSPLMISQRAAASIPIDDTYSDDEHWHWLAGFWRGLIKPNITVIINSQDEEPSSAPVVRIEHQDMSTLIITASKSEDYRLSKKQLRRIAFEIVEWLRQD